MYKKKNKGSKLEKINEFNTADIIIKSQEITNKWVSRGLEPKDEKKPSLNKTNRFEFQF